VIAAIVDGRGAPEAVVGVLGGASRVGLLLVLEREHAGEAGLLSSASCADCLRNSFLLSYAKFLQSHPPIIETFRFCKIFYLYNMFQPSTGSSPGRFILHSFKMSANQNLLNFDIN
jgi:hypothetical protein